MNVIILNTYEELSTAATKVLIDSIKATPKPLVCVASGDSPKGLYKHLVTSVEKNSLDIADWHFLGLDEAQTISVKHPNSLLYRLTISGDQVEVTHFLAQAGDALEQLSLKHTAQPVAGILGHEGEDVKQQGASAAMQSE